MSALYNLYHCCCYILLPSMGLYLTTFSAAGHKSYPEVFLHKVHLLLFSRIGQPYVGIASSFSFNDPNGMCKTCSGLGKMTKVDVEAILDLDKSWNEGCIRIPSTGPAPGTGSSMRHPACSIWTSLSGRIYKFHIIPGHHFIPLYCLPR